MYKVLKAKGHNTNIIIENDITKANVNIGRLTPKILDLLKSGGCAVDTDSLTLIDEWNLTISDDLAKTLAAMALPMNKPIRDQRKAKDLFKKSNKEIDAMDVLLGLAHYSK